MSRKISMKEAVEIANRTRDRAERAERKFWDEETRQMQLKMRWDEDDAPDLSKIRERRVVAQQPVNINLYPEGRAAIEWIRTTFPKECPTKNYLVGGFGCIHCSVRRRNVPDINDPDNHEDYCIWAGARRVLKGLEK